MGQLFSVLNCSQKWGISKFLVLTKSGVWGVRTKFLVCHEMRIREHTDKQGPREGARIHHMKSHASIAGIQDSVSRQQAPELQLGEKRDARARACAAGAPSGAAAALRPSTPCPPWPHPQQPCGRLFCRRLCSRLRARRCQPPPQGLCCITRVTVQEPVERPSVRLRMHISGRFAEVLLPHIA